MVLSFIVVFVCISKLYERLIVFPLGTVEEEASSVTGRKDSLSINLEFVKVSLSRMRRTGGPTFLESFIPTKGGKMDTTLINISGTSLH
jgi:hypothetical protein